MEVVLASRPKNEPDSTTFRLQPMVNPPTTAPTNGVLLQLTVASVDPYQRELIRRLELGTSPTNYQVARVLQSNHPSLSKGDLVMDFMARTRWQDVQQHDGNGLYRIPTELNIPLTAWAGVLGMPGRAAYFGLMDHEVGRMQAGKVVLVSGAAGAVGSLVGQLARLKGATKVIGTAGGPDKCARVKQHYGFDDCLDYKQHDTPDKMQQALKKAAPDGIDLYFDNTGGHVTTAAFDAFNTHGRMVLSGCISTYNKSVEDDVIPNVLSFNAIYKSINIRGYHSENDFIHRFHEFYDEVPKLVADGKIVYDETVYKGMDKIPEAFAGLFKGQNLGKAVVVLE